MKSLNNDMCTYIFKLLDTRDLLTLRITDKYTCGKIDKYLFPQYTSYKNWNNIPYEQLVFICTRFIKLQTLDLRCYCGPDIDPIYKLINLERLLL